MLAKPTTPTTTPAAMPAVLELPPDDFALLVVELDAVTTTVSPALVTTVAPVVVLEAEEVVVLLLVVDADIVSTDDVIPVR